MAEKADKVIIGDQTIIGNMTGDPELRFTPSGAAVVNFTVAENHSRFNKETQKWDEIGTSFYRCSLWRDAAENWAESAKRGDRVIIQGKVTVECYTPQEGAARVSLNCDVNEAALSARYATMNARKVERQAANNGNGGGGGYAPAPTAAPADPWATGAPATVPAGNTGYDEPPF